MLHTVSASSRDVLFASWLAVVVAASMLIAFAAAHLLSSPPGASAQGSSSNADLAQLEGGLNEKLIPRFDPKVTEYAVQIPQWDANLVTGNIYIVAVAKASGAEVTVTSRGDEISGGVLYTIPVADFGAAQKVHIKVTAPDGVTTKTYTLTTEPLATPTPTPIPSPTPTPPPTATPTPTPTPAPTATPDPLPPPLDLLLSMSGAGLQLDFTATANRYYSYELLQIVDGGKGTPIVAALGVAEDAPISFTGLTRAKSYFAQLRTCADAAGNTCGFNSTTSNTVSLAAHTATPTPTDTPSPTSTPTAQPTSTATPTHTATATPPPTATPTQTSTPAANATATATSIPSVVITPAVCGPATALGASDSSGRDRHELRLNIKYPKLGRDVGSLPLFWNEVVQKYTSALEKGLSAEQAFEITNDGISWSYDFVVKEPASTFPHYRVYGYLEFHQSSNMDHQKAYNLLKGFLASQGEKAALEVVFENYRFVPDDDYWGENAKITNLYIPLTLAGPLSELEEVERVKFYEVPHVTPETSQIDIVRVHGNESAFNNSSANNTNTAPWHGADTWHTAGYDGKGIRIGIIDVDFDKIQAYQKTANDVTKPLPRNIKSRCFSDSSSSYVDGDISKCDRSIDVHGSAVIEAVVSIAPKAELYISNATSIEQLKETLKWMQRNGVSVINQSAGREWQGPGDGTSWLSPQVSVSSDIKNAKDLYELIRYAVSNGILWVNSAGNYADSEIYYGDFMDDDGDGWIEFQDVTGTKTPDEVNKLPSLNSHYIVMRWKSSNPNDETDLDMYLCGNPDCNSAKNGNKIKYTVEKSNVMGRLKNAPIERVFITPTPTAAAGTPTPIPAPSPPMYLRICKQGGSEPEWIHIRSHSRDKLDYSGSYYTMNNPGEYSIPGMLAVGAAAMVTPTPQGSPFPKLELFSSRGPLPDDANVSDKRLLKPDIVAADQEPSIIYEDFTQKKYGKKMPFAGTSQAAPHVAGLAALVKQRYPSYAPVQIANYLTGAAERQKPASNDPGFGNIATPIFNNGWGYGFAQLPDDLPNPSAKLLGPPSAEVGKTFEIEVAELKPDVTPLKYETKGPIALGNCATSALSANAAIEIVPTSVSQKITFNACAAGEATIKLRRATDNQLIDSKEITIVDPDELPTASLTLSDDEVTVGETVKVTVDTASPAGTRFKLRVRNLSQSRCVAGQKASDEYETLSFATPKTFTFYGCWQGSARIQLLATDKTPLASPTPLSVFTPTPAPTFTSTPIPTSTPLPKPTAKLAVTRSGRAVSSIHVGDWVVARATDIEPPGTSVEFDASYHFHERRCPREGLSDEAAPASDQARDTLVDTFYGCEAGTAHIRLIRTADDYEIARASIRVTHRPTATPTVAPTATHTPTRTPTPTKTPTATPTPKPTGTLRSDDYDIDVGDLVRITATYNVPGNTRPRISYSSRLSPNCGGDSIRQQDEDSASDAVRGTRYAHLYGCTAGTATVRLASGSTELARITIRIRNRPTATPTPVPKPSATLTANKTSMTVGESVFVQATNIRPVGTKVHFSAGSNFLTRRCPYEGASDGQQEQQAQSTTSAIFYGCISGKGTIRLLRSSDNYAISSITIDIRD